jgi:hypothetical protein
MTGPGRGVGINLWTIMVDALSADNCTDDEKAASLGPGAYRELKYQYHKDNFR